MRFIQAGAPYGETSLTEELSSIVIDVTCPALILSSVMGTELPDSAR